MYFVIALAIVIGVMWILTLTMTPRHRSGGYSYGDSSYSSGDNSGGFFDGLFDFDGGGGDGDGGGND